MAWRRSCPCSSGQPQEAEWVYGKLTSISVPGNTKKKHPEKCLWIVSQFALQKEMQITTALSVLPLGSQNLFWFEAFFNLYNYHKNNTPQKPNSSFPVKFSEFPFLLVLITHFLFCFLFCSLFSLSTCWITPSNQHTMRKPCLRLYVVHLLLKKINL